MYCPFITHFQNEIFYTLYDTANSSTTDYQYKLSTTSFLFLRKLTSNRLDFSRLRYVFITIHSRGWKAFFRLSFSFRGKSAQARARTRPTYWLRSRLYLALGRDEKSRPFPEPLRSARYSALESCRMRRKNKMKTAR